MFAQAASTVRRGGGGGGGGTGWWEHAVLGERGGLITLWHGPEEEATLDGGILQVNDMAWRWPYLLVTNMAALEVSIFIGHQCGCIREVSLFTGHQYGCPIWLY